MDKLLTIEDVCAITGLRRSTIYKMVCEKRIPVVKISPRCIRFREGDIERWLRDKTVEAEALQPRTAPKPVKVSARKTKKPRNAVVDSIVEAAIQETLS